MKKLLLQKTSEVLRSTGGNNVWLIIFFIVHIVYIALSVFLPLPDGHEKSVLDIITRTAAAVLVGYFLSKNFISDRSASLLPANDVPRRSLQTDVAGFIGLCSLCLITFVRYVDAVELPYNVISQLRDFYLASIAFLMGTGENERKI